MTTFSEGVVRTVLPNGLTVLVKPVASAPVTTLWMWYRVGSRHEVPGITGASHWVEHMLFKGTELFPPGEADRLVARVGGIRNAMTWIDFTTYFHTVPASSFDLVLAIEADRMANSPFDAEEFEGERTVIISERQGAENIPQWLLDEDVKATAFKVHGYHINTIGWQCDLEQMTRNDLFEHYQRYYAPGNAILVACGAFDAAGMIARVRETFGQLPAGTEPAPERAIEPTQTGERRVIREGSGDTAYLEVAYHAPAAQHPDYFPMTVLDAILGGAQAMSLFAEGEPSRSSRLYRALVETGLAADVTTQLVPTVAPYLYGINVVVQTGVDVATVEAVLLAEIQRMLDEAVTSAELAKAIKQTRAEFIYGAESVTDQAYWLGFAELVASQDWLDTYLDQVAAVTPDDIQRVARAYLNAGNRTVGTFIPQS